MSNTNTKTRRLAAIMFTDIVGYTALMQHNEKKASFVRKTHRTTFEAQHEKYHGEILQYFGDGTLSVFQSAVGAVECAIAIQKVLNQQSIPLRIGLHLGDIVYDGTEIYGDGVNVASRIESMGIGGAILISSKVNDELKNQPHLSTLSLGKFAMKNVKEPLEIFAIANEGLKIPEHHEMKGKREKKLKAIAVLPFVNMSRAEENEYFSDGMTEEIINALTKIQGLKVTSRTSSFFFKNKNISVGKIGQQLNVNVILEGSIRLAGHRVRITAQLIDVAEDVHFWSETFDRDMNDIFALQDEISLLIAERLREQIGHFDIDQHLIEAPKITVDTYNIYLKSRYHMQKMAKSEIEMGISLLEKVINDNPNYPYAYLGMHLGYTLLGTLGFLPSAEAFMKGKNFLDKAILLAPELPECQLQLAWISLLGEWNWEKTYQHLRKVLEKQPIVDYYQTMASTLVAEGKTAAAMNYINTAFQLDPFSEVNHHLKGFIYYVEGKYEEALPFFEKGVALNNNYAFSGLYLVQTHILMKEPAKALAFFQNIPNDKDGNILKLGGITLAYAALGKTKEAKMGLKEITGFLNTSSVERAINILVLCHTLLGETEEAIQMIENGIKSRLPLMIYYPTEPMLYPLRKDARFESLMKQIMGKVTDFNFQGRKYKKALFNEIELKKYKSQLQQLLEEEQPFLNPDLSLNDLANLMAMPANYLSQLLNEGLDMNFSELINTYRLEIFKEKLVEPNAKNFSILGLAFESGFNSKTVFNTFFKKKMGMTPSAYWKSLLS